MAKPYNKIAYKGNVSLKKVDPGAETFLKTLSFKPTVTSGFRTKAKNVAVGGVPGSQHTTGTGFDVRSKNLSSKQIREAKEKGRAAGWQSIQEKDHLHFQRPRRGKLGGLMAPRATGILPQGGVPQAPTEGKRNVQALWKKILGFEGEGIPWEKLRETAADRMNRLQALGAAFGSGGGRAAREVRQQFLGGQQARQTAKEKREEAELKRADFPGKKEYDFYRQQFFLEDPEGVPLSMSEWKMARIKAGVKIEEPTSPQMQELIDLAMAKVKGQLRGRPTPTGKAPSPKAPGGTVLDAAGSVLLD